MGNKNLKLELNVIKCLLSSCLWLHLISLSVEAAELRAQGLTADISDSVLTGDSCLHWPEQVIVCCGQ